MAMNYQYHSPSTLDQALDQLRDLGSQAVVKAGGTDVYLRMKLGITNAGHLVDIGGLQDLNYIRYQQDGLRIGAVTTVRDIEKSSEIREKYPALADAAAKVASVQIRNMGTIAGNLCQDNMCWFYNQSRLWKQTQPPCFKAGGSKCHLMGGQEGVCYATYRGDLAPVLIAMGARVKVQSATDERIIPLEELYSGNGKDSLTLKGGELLTEIWLPPVAANSAVCYLKRSHRKAVDYPLVGAAAFLAVDSGNKITDARLVLTAVGSAPVVVEEAAKILKGRNLKDLPLEEVDQYARQQAKPVNNVYHGTAKYRKQMAGLLAKRCVSLIAANLTVKEV